MGIHHLLRQTGSINKDIKYYTTKSNQSNYQDIRNFTNKSSTDYTSAFQKTEFDENSSQLNNLNGNKEIIYSLNQLNKRSTETRNSPKNNLVQTDSDFENGASQAHSFFKSLKWATLKPEQQIFVTKIDLEEVWNAIEFQNKTINYLLKETSNLNMKLLEAENRLGWKIKDIQQKVSNVSSNFEINRLNNISQHKIKETDKIYKWHTKREQSASRSQSPIGSNSSKLCLQFNTINFAEIRF